MQYFSVCFWLWGLVVVVLNYGWLRIGVDNHIVHIFVCESSYYVNKVLVKNATSRFGEIRIVFYLFPTKWGPGNGVHAPVKQPQGWF